MLKTFQRILNLTLIGAILFGMFSAAFASPSSWAEPFVKAMLLEGLASEELLDTAKMQQPITREEFAELTVRLYAKSKDKNLDDLIEWNPFTDTNNEMVARAFNIGIVSGTGEDAQGRKKFSPNNKVTRQEIAVMLVKELKLLGVDTVSKGQMPYSDEQTIASWAYDAVAFASSNGILSGVGNNEVAPTAHATREQALVLIHKIATKYGWVDNKYVGNHFTSSNSSTHLGFVVPKSSASELIVIKNDDSVKYIVSNMVNSYQPNIKQQQTDLIRILYQSDKVTYNALKTLYNMILESYDPISKTFKSSNSVYINLTTGQKTSSKPSGSCIGFKVDGQIIMEYFN